MVGQRSLNLNFGATFHLHPWRVPTKHMAARSLTARQQTPEKALPRALVQAQTAATSPRGSARAPFNSPPVHSPTHSLKIKNE